MERWVDKVAVVTGASSGVGVAIAQRLVEEGLKVAALANKRHRLDLLDKQLTGKKGKLYPVEVTFTNEEDIVAVFKWISSSLGRIHVLVNNASVFKKSTVEDGDTSDWRKIFDTNVHGLNVATREAVRDMHAGSVQGHVVNVNSVLGHSVGNRLGVGVYAASKFAVTAMSEALRLELNAHRSRIKSTNLSVGLVKAEMSTRAGDVEKLVEEAKILVPEQVAEAVVYVLSTPPLVQIQELSITPVVEA